MLGREIKGNIAAWSLNNRHLFDYYEAKLPRSTALSSGKMYEQNVLKSMYPQKLNGLIQSTTNSWPNAKVIFVAQSNPNCYFLSHSHFRAPKQNPKTVELCGKLQAIHNYTQKHIHNNFRHNKNLQYEPLFLDNPYDRSGSSDAIHTNSRGSAGIAEALTPRIQKHLNP